MFQNQFTWHAFRFVEISNFIGFNLRESEIRAFRIHADVIDEKTYFKTSNRLVNSIHFIMQNSYLSNFVGGVQSDCPHRERFGYSGDVHASGEGFDTFFFFGCFGSFRFVFFFFLLIIYVLRCYLFIFFALFH
jgi:alpha-L-rhamnosidase